MTIKEVCESFKLSADTLRYYEKIGIIPKIPRNENGIRNYDHYSLEWIKFIKCMREAGLPIKILVEYVELVKQGEATNQIRKNILVIQKNKLEEKLKTLKNTIDILEYKIQNYNKLMLEAEKNLNKT